MHKGYAIAKARRLATRDGEKVIAIHCGCGIYAVKLLKIYPIMPAETVAIAFPDGSVRERDASGVLTV